MKCMVHIFLQYFTQRSCTQCLVVVNKQERRKVSLISSTMTCLIEFNTLSGH